MKRAKEVFTRVALGLLFTVGIILSVSTSADDTITWANALGILLLSVFAILVNRAEKCGWINEDEEEDRVC